MPALSVMVLCAVSVAEISVVIVAMKERASLAKELALVVAGIERRTESSEKKQRLDAAPRSPPGLEELLDELVQSESHQLAVLAANELCGRAELRRTRARLFSRGLPRIALLSGGAGAFVVAAAGSFSSGSLTLAAGLVAFGFVCSFACMAFSSASLRLAKKYLGIVDVLAREVERHLGSGPKQPRGGTSPLKDQGLAHSLKRG